MTRAKSGTIVQNTADPRIWNITNSAIYSYAGQEGYCGVSVQSMRKRRPDSFRRKHCTDVKAAKVVPTNRTVQKQKETKRCPYRISSKNGEQKAWKI